MMIVTMHCMYSVMISFLCDLIDLKTTSEKPYSSRFLDGSSSVNVVELNLQHVEEYELCSCQCSTTGLELGKSGGSRTSPSIAFDNI